MNGLTPVNERSSNVTFLSIKNGRITRKNPETSEEEIYQSVTGILTGLTERTADFNGTSINFIELHLTCGNEKYKLSVNRDSGAARSLINALASAMDFTAPLVIKPWLGDPDELGKRYTNVSVYVGQAVKENKLPWAVTLPKVNYVQVGRNLVPDDSARFAALQQLMQGIRSRLGSQPQYPAPGLGQVNEYEQQY